MMALILKGRLFVTCRKQLGSTFHSDCHTLTELNGRRNPGDQIRHFDRTFLSNRIEGESFGFE